MSPGLILYVLTMNYHVATFITCWIACFSTLSVYSLVPLRHQTRPPNVVLNGAVAVETGVEMNMESLSNELISKLRFRAVRQELERRALDTSGTLSAMKNRLREAALGLKSTNGSIENEEARAIDMGRNVLDEVWTRFISSHVSLLLGDSPRMCAIPFLR